MVLAQGSLRSASEKHHFRPSLIKRFIYKVVRLCLYTRPLRPTEYKQCSAVGLIILEDTSNCSDTHWDGREFENEWNMKRPKIEIK